MSDELVPIRNDLETRGLEGARISTSLDFSKPGVRSVMLEALQNCDARITEHIGEPIDVRDYFIHDVECKDRKTGEIRQAERMVLIDANGMLHECVSETLISSLRNIASLYGRFPWNEPKTLIPRMKRKGELSIYFFEVKE